MSDYIAHTETANGYRLDIIQDSDAESPRSAYEEAATMVCEHRRYNLGDDDGREKAIAAVRSSRDYRDSWEDYENPNMLDLSEPNQLWEAIQRCSDIVSNPLYLYDHSGITISMGRFSCAWDSGQVGFIFMTKAQILDCYMKPATARLTPALKAKALELMEGETKTYDSYLTGDVYGYTITKLDSDEEQDDSCWGFYGLEYAIEEGQSILAHYAAIEPQLELEPA